MNIDSFIVSSKILLENGQFEMENQRFSVSRCGVSA